MKIEISERNKWRTDVKKQSLGGQVIKSYPIMCFPMFGTHSLTCHEWVTKPCIIYSLYWAYCYAPLKRSYKLGYKDLVI